MPSSDHKPRHANTLSGEAAEIDATPEAERQEIRDIYAAKGFTGDLLDRSASTRR